MLALINTLINYIKIFVIFFNTLFLYKKSTAIKNKRIVNLISIETEKKTKNFFLSKNVHFCKVAHVPKYFPRKSSPKSSTVTYSQAFPKFVIIDVFFSNTIWSFRSLHCCNKKKQIRFLQIFKRS